MALDPDIQARLDAFRADLPGRTPTDIVRRHVTLSAPHALTDAQHTSLRQQVAQHFGGHPNDVIVVGSAKLGFSLASEKRYRPFGDASDIDVAVVSDDVFDRIWQEVFEYAESGAIWPKKKQFVEYHFRGWIRPDLLPSSPVFTTAEDWWEFFRALERSGEFGDLKIRAGLYRTQYFLERYQQIAVQECQEEVRSRP